MTAATGTSTARRVTQAALARELGVTRQAVNDLVTRGVLVRDADGKLDAEQAAAIIRERVRPTGKTAAAVAPPAGSPSLPLPGAAPGKTDHAAGYYVAKAQREASEAGIAQLRLEQMQGNLIDRDATVQAVFTAFRMLRNQMMFVPRKLSGQLLGKTTPRDVQQIVETEIRASLDLFQRKTLAGLAGNIGSAMPADEGEGA
ncbi:MAG: hypothetical protein SHS37scaffold296_43 [Burkholderiales phage 68_11]|jgi:hypothetical protein|nr:MAG: hypothetical protein SHS37scaffold296_43 [Burkholderiales phage 68_11]